jgi:hypothetical protein
MVKRHPSSHSLPAGRIHPIFPQLLHFVILSQLFIKFSLIYSVRAFSLQMGKLGGESECGVNAHRDAKPLSNVYLFRLIFLFILLILSCRPIKSWCTQDLGRVQERLAIRAQCRCEAIHFYL